MTRKEKSAHLKLLLMDYRHFCCKSKLYCDIFFLVKAIKVRTLLKVKSDFSEDWEKRPQNLIRYGKVTPRPNISITYVNTAIELNPLRLFLPLEKNQN